MVSKKRGKFRLPIQPGNPEVPDRHRCREGRHGGREVGATQSTLHFNPRDRDRSPLVQGR